MTVPWDRGLGKGYAYNTDTSLYPFVRIANGAQPDQISITYQSPTSVVVNWVVGKFAVQERPCSTTRAGQVAESVGRKGLRRKGLRRIPKTVLCSQRAKCSLVV